MNYYPVDASLGVCPGATAAASPLGLREDSLFVFTGAVAQLVAVTPPLAGKDTLGYLPARRERCPSSRPAPRADLTGQRCS